MAKKKAKEDREEKDEKDLRTPVARDGAYVMMLFITLVAIIAGCVFMYLDNDEYGQKQPPKEPAPAILKLGDAPAAAAPKAGETTPGGGAPMGGAPMGGAP
jgi:hypothetical protein